MSVNADVFAGSSEGFCLAVSDNFFLDISGTLGIDAVFTITSTVGGDTITPNPATIFAGDTEVLFTVTPVTCGIRTITISTSTPGVIVTTPTADYTSDCACPDDSGSQWFATYTATAITCPPSLSMTWSFTPTDLQSLSVYCTSSPVTVTITE